MHAGVDLILVDKIVNEVKSQGVFDQFRKDSMADVDTKPAYQNLRQRVETSVGKFLADQKWKSDLNKFQLREKLRKYIVEAGFLDTGVERIVDQVVNPKISTVFQPKIEDIAYKYLGIEKPHTSPQTQCLNGSLDIKTDLLPTDLEAVSPDSDKTKSESKEDIFNESNEDKNEEFESPPFEPIESVVVSTSLKKDDSDNSHLSGISGLTSQDSVSSEHKAESPVAKFAVSADTQPESELSEVSSNSRLSIVTNEDNSQNEKPMVKKPADVDISEEAQMPKFSENSEEANTQHDLHFDIKREDIKFEGTERKVDGNLFSFSHRDVMDIKREDDQLELDIKSECKIDPHFKSEEAYAKSQHDSEIKTEDALGDSISTKHSLTTEDDKRGSAAVDMSLSENDSSGGSNSTGSRSRNKHSLDLHSNGSRSGSFRPRPPSPPNDCMLQKPPSPNYYMLPAPPPPPTPPPPPPPGDDLYMHPPLPPSEPQLSSKPPSPPRMPPLPSTPPPPPGEEPPLPGIPLRRQIPPNVQPSSPPLPPPKEEYPTMRHQPSSPERAFQHDSKALASFSSKGAAMVRTPPSSPPETTGTKEFDYTSPEQKSDSASGPFSSTPLSPSLQQRTGSPKHFRYERESDMRSKYETAATPTKSGLHRPPSPKYKPPSPPSPPRQKIGSPQYTQRYDYRPPSPKQQHSASPNQLSQLEDVSSPLNEDYANSPSPPPYEELRPNSPTSFDLKSISSKETSFSLSETSQNETMSKPPSPFSPKDKVNSSKDQEATKQSTSPQSKSKTDQPLKPPSTPPQSKSSSKSENRSSKSSSHHSHHHKSSKSSKDDKSSSKSHSHRSSSSSSRNHTSSSHRSSDEKKRSSSSSSSSKHKSKSDSRDKERDKDKNRKKDDHSSARHKERRRKSTDSNDGDSHRHGSKHGSSRHGHERSSHSTTKESTSNSNSSGNFSSNSNSCNDPAQGHSSAISRSKTSKDSHRSSGKDEDLRFFIISEEERRNTEALLSKLNSTIGTNSTPAYLLDCDEDVQGAVKHLTENVINVQDDKSIRDVSKYTVTYLNSDLSAPKPAQMYFQDKIMKTSNGKWPIMNNVSRKRKANSPSRTVYKMLTPSNDKRRNETCLIIDCIEYDKPHKMSCLTEDRVNVSPTSSDISVSSKENECIDTKMKNISQNTKNGKMIKAEGIVRIEKSNNNNGFKIKNQRYSSEDLYKPRPLLSQRPRRRELLGDADPA